MPSSTDPAAKANAPPGPLAGLTVLDLTNVLAGPFCCHQLAHLGAEVIKIEVPGRGDLARQLGADADLNQARMGVSFLAQNAGKKSLTLNLKDARGQDILKRLVRVSDVLVENFRPGVMARLGVGPEVLHAENDQLIYCAISGFGQDGPMRDLPAYDQIVQGLSGVMSITGDIETAPYRVGYPLCDTIGGLTAAMAINAALAGRARNGGTIIDVSMLEATLATMGWVVSNYLIAGVSPSPNGNENMTSAPSGTFQAADGLLNIAANKQEQFEALCCVLSRTELLTHPDFETREKRKTNRQALRDALEQSLIEHPAAHWVAKLNGAGVPAGEVLSVEQALALPQVRDRGMIAEFDNVSGVDRSIRTVRTGFKIDGTAPAVTDPPPALGRHTNEVLTRLGVSQEEQQSLREEGVV